MARLGTSVSTAKERVAFLRPIMTHGGVLANPAATQDTAHTPMPATINTDLHPVEWCLSDSPAQRWLEAHGYREVEYRRFHPGETTGWIKMVKTNE
jgi:hypothetical protein